MNHKSIDQILNDAHNFESIAQVDFTTFAKRIDQQLSTINIEYSKYLSILNSMNDLHSAQVVESIQELIGSIYKARQAIANATA